MANPKIKVKRSSVEGKVPAVSQLERGELAVNSYDGKVYILRDQFSVGIATTTHTINPWNEPNGVGAGISYSGDTLVVGIATFFKTVRAHNGIIIGDDNKSILLGTSDDMRIRHTGSHSEITDEGTGDLRLGSSRTVIGNPTFSETCARFVQNGPSELYHDNTLRLKTSSSGVNITDDLGVSGIATATGGLTVGNYDFPTVAGSEGLVLKVASDGNLEFGSGASGGVVPTEKTFTATQGQTVFTDTTNLPTYVQVFVNGIKIRPTSDFSQSGASITLVTAATAGDEIDLVRFD